MEPRLAASRRIVLGVLDVTPALLFRIAAAWRVDPRGRRSVPQILVSIPLGSFECGIDVLVVNKDGMKEFTEQIN